MGHAYLGNNLGPFSITCVASENLGQWTWRTDNCNCLNCTRCSQISGTDCGWCGRNGKCYLGDSNGPYAPLYCSENWIRNNRNCPSLNSKHN